MAGEEPLPMPPRTPPPPPLEVVSVCGIGRETSDADEMAHPRISAPTIHTDHDYDISQGLTDTPVHDHDDHIHDDRAASSMLSPTRASFSSVHSSPMHSGGTFDTFTQQNGGRLSLSVIDHDATDSTPGVRNPFNFTPVQYSAGVGQNASAKGEALGRRKGHKYRHSSVHASHMDTIFQSPARKAVLSVPGALPMPTRKEAWWSMTPHQSGRLAWCLCHFLVAAYVQFAGEGSMAMTALSRLLLFDAAGATVCVAVDVMGNFEVWKRSSIKHPFGLERADVLAGFGMAVFIAFMGLDVISHGVQHSLENLGTHEAHTTHGHGRVAAGSVDVASLLAIISTLISAVLLGNHARIGKAMRFDPIARWGRVLGNPSHFLTLSCSVLLLILPFLDVVTYKSFDLVLACCVALLMITLGVRLGVALGSMLLMSFKTQSTDKLAVRDVIHDIETDPGVTAVEEARFWQVHYGLCMASLKLRYRCVPGYGDDMSKIRQRVTSLIRQRLGDGKGLTWEISVQMGVEVD